MHPATWGDYPAVVIRDGLAFGVPMDDELCALSLTDGSIQWSTPLPGRTAPFAPAVGDDHVIFGTSDGQVRSVARSDGAPCWTAPIDVIGLVQPLIIGDRVVVRNARSGEVVALDLRTGSIEWRAKVPKSTSFEPSQSLCHADTIIVTGAEGLVWLDLATGERVHEVAVGRLTWVAYGRHTLPVPFETGLLLASGSGLHAYRWS